MSLTNQEAREEVRNLIAVGKERGYLLSDEIDSILPAGEHTPEEIDGLAAGLINAQDFFA